MTTTAKLIAWLTIAASLAVGPSAVAAGPITKAQAAKTARYSASEYLEMSGIPFQVRPSDWRVSCRHRRRWVCRVWQGPCRGRLRIERVTLGGGLRGIGRVGCIAD